jgi:hypothetical protein
MLSERITERTACAETHAIELLDHLTFPGSTTYDQKPCEEPMTRRTVLKAAGRGMEAAALSLAAAGALAQNTGGKVSLSLIVDDGSPVDPLFYEIPGYETPFLVPAEFTARVAETFERFDLRGKLTIIPMPSCLGRIDQSLKRVPPDHLQAFLKIVRERIAPRFDITPEFLTHLRAYDLKKGGYQHIFEDAWITRAPLEEVVEYFTLAFQILQNVGLPATGITSPWDSGIDVEKKYAQALADAQWKVFQRKLTWYFLYSVGSGPPRKLSVEYQAPERGQTVVSVPANFPDIFWSMERPVAERRQFIQNNIDHLLSADGRTGRIRELIESNHPVILLTHWQSLYTQGTGLGLEGLTALAERIQKVFGNNVEWISCSERARRFVNG